MARSRIISHGFFHNEDLIELHPLTRLLFAGLWTIADREGRLEDRPKRIKLALLPADDHDIDAALSDLERSGFLVRYTVGDRKYIQISTFRKHQKPHVREAASVIPPQTTTEAPPSTDKGEPEASPDNASPSPRPPVSVSVSVLDPVSVSDPVTRSVPAAPSQPATKAVASTPPSVGKERPLALPLRRVKVWRSMLDRWIERLGPHAEHFDFDTWLARVDDEVAGVVLPSTGREWWNLLDEKFSAEIARRQLPTAGGKLADGAGERSSVPGVSATAKYLDPQGVAL